MPAEPSGGRASVLDLMAELGATRPEGIEGSLLKGPFAVGEYAAALARQLRGFARVQLVGEVSGVRLSRAKVYWQLRDARGALDCAMWRADFEALGLPAGALADGAQVVVAGGTDYYPGSAQASPHFHFAVADLRIAGEGDLLAQVDRLRRVLDAEGLLLPQKRLARPELPRTIGVVTGEGGKARDDVLAGLRRRGWEGRLVWAFAPVQDRHAAPRITRALQDLAAVGGVDVIVVARGGGSFADLLAFCDETLCRTVALLPVPVISSVGHHTDRTLIDDVAAVCCSTPTHAAEAAVPRHPGQARQALAASAHRLSGHGRRAVLLRAVGVDVALGLVLGVRHPAAALGAGRAAHVVALRALLDPGPPAGVHPVAEDEHHEDDEDQEDRRAPGRGERKGEQCHLHAWSCVATRQDGSLVVCLSD